MDFNEYAVKAQQTAVFTRNDYPLVALGEEVGEVMGKIAKFGRKNDMSVEEVINAICLQVPEFYFGRLDHLLFPVVQRFEQLFQRGNCL